MNFQQSYFNSYGIARQGSSYMRLLNASPDISTGSRQSMRPVTGTSAVDVYANGSLIAQGLSYKGFTEYMQVVPGIYNIRVFPAGTTGASLLDTQVEIPVQSIVTTAIIGISPNISAKAFFEPVLQIPAGKLYLRFANLAPDSPDMDLVISNGTALFENVSYGAAASYISISPGLYTFYIQQSGTNRSLLYVPNIQLMPGRFYTVYAVGQAAGPTPLQVLIPLDGNSYIKLSFQV